MKHINPKFKNREELISCISNRLSNIIFDKKKYLNYQKLLEKISDLYFMVLKVLRNARSQDDLEKKMFFILNRFFAAVPALEVKIKDDHLLHVLKNEFRCLFLPILKKSKLTMRGYLKPFGYPGDYRIIEAVYNNVPISPRGLGHIFDKYLLQDNYVKAVRDRKDRMKKILKLFINQCDKRDIDILNIACGSCREIREIYPELIKSKKRISFVLLDQEKRAIDFVKSKFDLESRNVSFNYINRNVIDLYQKDKNYKSKIQKKDLIYSIGLADYLPNSILGPLIKCCSELLKNDGFLVIAHKNVIDHPQPVSDWVCDWKFIPRSKNDITVLFEKFLQNSRFQMSFLFDKNDHVFYAIIRNKKSKFKLDLKTTK